MNHVDQLKSIFNDPSIGLASADSLYHTAKKQGLAVTKKQVNEIYKTFTTAQVFRPIENKFFSLIRGARPFARCQIDLLDLSNEAPRQNQGFKWLFILLDTCTRYVFAIPMKNKSAQSCVDAFTQILNKLPNNIVQLDSDSERAFTSAQFQDLCAEHNIRQHLVEVGDHRALGFIDSFCRTIRILIERYKASSGSNDWLKVIDLLISNYNGRKHIILKMSPDQALAAGTRVADDMRHLARQYNHAKLSSQQSQDIRLGDTVRVQLHRAQFAKGTKPTFSSTTHHVIAEPSDGLFNVTGREVLYKRYELLKIDSTESTEQPAAELEQAEHQRQRRIIRRVNKEGIARASPAAEVAHRPRRQRAYVNTALERVMV